MGIREAKKCGGTHIFPSWYCMKLTSKGMGIAAMTLFLLVCMFCPNLPFGIYAVDGSSMEPTVSDDDMLVLVHVSPKMLKTGDIIAFRPQHGKEWQGPPIAHRIVAIDEAGHITTKGDNVGSADPYDICPGDVIGRVVLVIPGAGAVIRVATSAYGYVALVLIPSLWLIANELKNLRGWRARL